MLETHATIKSLLDYYQAIGASEVYTNMPTNWLDEKADFALKAAPVVAAPTPQPVAKQPAAPASPAYAFKGMESLIAQLNKCLSLDDLKTFTRNIDDFAIKRTAMNMVFGTGQTDADIMIISDFPNESDDASGTAFSGPIGELTRKMLGAIKLDFETLYACYLLPWRPPGNRTPSKKEIEFFSHLLKRHIALVNPKTLLLMGHSALKALTENHQIALNSCRGKQNTYECPFTGTHQTFYVTYNPMHLQKFPEYKKRAWEDLQLFETEMKLLNNA